VRPCDRPGLVGIVKRIGFAARAPQPSGSDALANVTVAILRDVLEQLGRGMCGTVIPKERFEAQRDEEMDCLRAVADGIEEVLLEAERERRAEEGQRDEQAAAEEAPGEESRRSTCGRVTRAAEPEEVRTLGDELEAESDHSDEDEFYDCEGEQSEEQDELKECATGELAVEQELAAKEERLARRRRALEMDTAQQQVHQRLLQLAQRRHEAAAKAASATAVATVAAALEMQLQPAAAQDLELEPEPEPESELAPLTPDAAAVMARMAAKAASPLSPVIEELEEPSARLELPPPPRLVKVKDRGWRSDENKIFDGGGGKHTHT
jgi:hypothetical protein